MNKLSLPRCFLIVIGNNVPAIPAQQLFTLDGKYGIFKTAVLIRRS